MIANKDLILNEWVINEGWLISRKFMQEIEREMECQGKLPVNLMMVSGNLVVKWLEFERRN